MLYIQPRALQTRRPIIFPKDKITYCPSNLDVLFYVFGSQLVANQEAAHYLPFNKIFYSKQHSVDGQSVFLDRTRTVQSVIVL